MTSDAAKVELSPLEEERFGVRTARVASFTAGAVPAIVDFCRRHDVRLLIARCSTSDLAAAQALEAQGGRLMDTLVYLARDLAAPLPPAPATPLVRSLRPDDEPAVVAIARESFRGYVSHYHADPRLDPVKCDAAYVSWAERSCRSTAAAEDVLVAEDAGQVAGFLTLKWNSPEEGEGPLFAVSPRIQQRGVGAALMAAALRWFRDRGAARMVMSTQISNRSSQKVWVRLGFEPSRSDYTFHAWFDRA
jgi:GNAT superfamily N-acetyltransferase